MNIKFDGLWRHVDFRRLWAAQTVSVFGSMISGTALPFTAILALDASPFEVALLFACNIVPGLVIGPLAGVWVDRLRRRPVMIAADVGRAALLATIPLAYLFDALRLEHLYVVALGVSVLTMFFEVAYRSYLPSLVAREELLEGNSKLTASSAVSEFAGFSVSGWLVQLVNGPFAVFIDALTFVSSAFFVRSIEAPEERPAASESVNMRADITEGFSAVSREPFLRAMAGATLLYSTGFGLYGAVYMLFVTRELGFHPGVLGVIFGIGGISSLLGAVLAERSSSRFGVGASIWLGLVIMGVSMLLVLGAQGATLAGASLLIAQQVLGDGAFTAQDVNAVSLRQAITPDNLLGRVNAFMHNIDRGFVLFGTLAGGLLGEFIGLRATLTLGGLFVIGAGALVLLTPLASARSPAVTVTPVGGEP
jgi:MFS family permease